MSLNKDERDMLIRIDERTEELVKKNEDIENRVRGLEKWKWAHISMLVSSHGLMAGLKELLK